MSPVNVTEAVASKLTFVPKKVISDCKPAVETDIAPVDESCKLEDEP